MKTVKEEQDRYLAARQSQGTFVAACKKARVSPNTVYGWRATDHETGYLAEDFCRLENKAKDEYTELLESEADRRGFKGVLEPIYQGGKRVGQIRKFSDVLLIFRLKALAPDKYRERISNEHSGPGGGAIPVSVRPNLSKLSDEELRQLEQLVEKAADTG